jgi:hypothetical protein
MHFQGDIRDDVTVQYCTIKNINEWGIGLGTFAATRSNYEAIEIFYNDHMQHLERNVPGKTGDGSPDYPHGASLVIWGENIHVKGHRCVAPSGSGAIRFYESYGPYDNMTIEDSLFVSPYASNGKFYYCGENVVIRNNTFISGLRTDVNLKAYRYQMAVLIGAGTGFDVTFKNNMVLGMCDVGGLASTIDGGNNVIWSLWSNGAWASTWDSNDVIVCSGVDSLSAGYTANYFELPGNVFVGSSDFEDYFTSLQLPSNYMAFALPSTSMLVDAGQPSADSGYEIRGLERDDSPDIGAFEYIAAAPPLKASGPTPSNGATGVSLSALLEWGGTADNWNVYVGTSPSALTLQGNVQERDYNYDLAYSTTYYWRIDANNSEGLTTGDVWSFTTVAETTAQPAKAVAVYPANGARNVDTSINLRWGAVTGAIAYNVYYGTTSLALLTSTSSTSAAVTLSDSTNYIWRVDVVGSYGTTTGDVWSFQTIASGGPTEPNEPGGPGAPDLPDFPTLPTRTRTPLNQAARTPPDTSRQRIPYQGLFCYELVSPDGLPGSYATDENLSGYLRRIVIIPVGSDDEWSLTIKDAFGGEVFSVDGMDMGEGVVAYDYDGEGVPFVGGLVAVIAGTTGDTADGIWIELLIDETWRR